MYFAGSHGNPKIPTVISYNPEKVSEYTWGAQRHRYTSIREFKLALDPDQPRPTFVSQTSQSKQAKDLKQLNKSAEDVVADYLKALYSHALQIIKGNVLQEYVESCKKKFVLTVPAVWSDKAKDATLKVSMLLILAADDIFEAVAHYGLGCFESWHWQCQVDN